ncbi:MAG: hypothetical protein ABSD99_13040, partial [Candidatus Bathyarchaeia archaeon]
INIGDVIRSVTPKDSDGSPLVRYHALVVDSSNNAFTVNGKDPSEMELKFGATPISERISPILPLGLTSALLYLFARRSRGPNSAYSP